jgi:hypothetical protein
MRYLLILFASCSTYQGIIVSEDEFTQTARCKVSDSHYIWVTIDTDSFEVGDTIYIDKTNLRVLR